MKQELEWRLLAHQEVISNIGCKGHIRLGRLLGCGGAGAVYNLPNRDGWVIKVLDNDSPVAEQELKSLSIFRGSCRYEKGLMKFHSWSGTLECDEEVYSCYLMRKGRTLAQAIQDGEEWLKDPKKVMIQTAYLVNGICSLKNLKLSHGDIKADNILLFEYKNTFYSMLSDYGTVSAQKHKIRTNPYHCEDTEYSSPLEERIAYDLHCLYMVLCQIYGVEDDVLEDIDENIFKLLRIMRNTEDKAFDRLHKIMDFLQKYRIAIPVAFYLDAIPTYELTEDFPFEKVMSWGEYAVLRDKNAIPGTAFDPLLLLPVKHGRYEEVYEVLVRCNELNAFVMPIARYFDKDGNEYVLIHAPDDKNKHPHKWHSDFSEVRIQDDTGEPYTLDIAPEGVTDREMRCLGGMLVGAKINITFSAGDIWHMDGRWKLNLFTADYMGPVCRDPEKCNIFWT